MSVSKISECSSLNIKLLSCSRHLTTTVKYVVDEIWERKISEKNGKLFNGQIFCVEKRDGNLIWGSFQEYKLLIAQYERPELYEELQITSLAVTGLLHWGDRILLGHRNSYVAQNQDQWELAPAGGLDPDALNSNGDIEPLNTLLAEAKEELDIELELGPFPPTPRLIIESPTDHVIDIVYFVDMNSRQIDLLERIDQVSNDEYDRLSLLSLKKFSEQEKEMKLNSLTRDCLEYVSKSPKRFGF